MTTSASTAQTASPSCTSKKYPLYSQIQTTRWRYCPWRCPSVRVWWLSLQEKTSSRNKRSFTMCLSTSSAPRLNLTFSSPTFCLSSTDSTQGLSTFATGMSLDQLVRACSCSVERTLYALTLLKRRTNSQSSWDFRTSWRVNQTFQSSVQIKSTA